MDKVGIQNSKFKIVVDGINSIGGVAIPKLLDSLNVEVVKINCNPNGNFAHDPEPLAENLRGLCDAVLENNADLGIAVDPDVDRLVIVDEKGKLFSEEYTLVACADYILSQQKVKQFLIFPLHVLFLMLLKNTANHVLRVQLVN